MMLQRTPAWRAVRNGKFTASEVGPFIVNSGKVAETARRKLVFKKLGELNGEEEESTFQSDDMKRGTALEPIAREQYVELTAFNMIEVGFLEHDDLPVGCSPDGLILSRELNDPAEDWLKLVVGGAEIKCPRASTHIRYLIDGCLPDEYRVQIHTSLAVSGLPWWDFFSFSPVVTEWEKTRDGWTVMEWNPGHLPPFYIRTYRDSYTEEIAAGLRDLTHKFHQQMATIATIQSTPIKRPTLYRL